MVYTFLEDFLFTLKSTRKTNRQKLKYRDKYSIIFGTATRIRTNYYYSQSCTTNFVVHNGITFYAGSGVGIGNRERILSHLVPYSRISLHFGAVPRVLLWYRAKR